MEPKVVLLVEDEPNDEALALRALRKNDIRNQVVVACDGIEALDYLFATGAHWVLNLPPPRDRAGATAGPRGER